jgi:hypothetical protein
MSAKRAVISLALTAEILRGWYLRNSNQLTVQFLCGDSRNNSERGPQPSQNFAVGELSTLHLVHRFEGV